MFGVWGLGFGVSGLCWSALELLLPPVGVILDLRPHGFGAAAAEAHVPVGFRV